MAAGDLVVTDLDGTLWHVEEEIHPAIADAVRRLVADGPPLLAATGRRKGSTKRALQRIGVLPPAVVLNGAMGVDLATEERFRTTPFAAADAAVVLDAFLAVGLHPCLYVDEPDHEVVVDETPSTHANHLADLGEAVRRADLLETVRSQPVFAFTIIGLSHALLDAARQKVGGAGEAHLDRAFDVPGEAAMTVSPPGLSKWEGVVAWCAHAGIRPSRVIAVGDSTNDVELLTNADLAIVPENAHPTALALADVVIPRPVDGGWARVLDHL